MAHGETALSTNCKHGLDARFCSMCAPKFPRRTPSALHRPSSARAVTLDDIVEYLNDQKIRATYGAVAQVVGGIAQSIGERLGGAFGRRPEASWVVNADTGLPTGYTVKQTHPALQSRTDIIRTGDELVRRMEAWQTARRKPPEH